LFHAETNGLDITPRQFAVLEKINEQEGLSQTSLVERTGVDRSTMGNVVQRLVTKRLVHRRRTASDARAYELTLTTEGREVLELAQPIASRSIESSLRRFPRTSRANSWPT
jgi:DNA-binding MarR family transcriptional regulator